MLASILPPGAAAAEMFGDAYGRGELYPAEAAAIAGAASKRRREFTAVRMCARDALARAGLPPAALVPGPAGAPAWPPGAVGSMTHCDGYRACAVARTEVVAALGIDAEPHEALPPGVLDVVASRSERAALDRLAKDMPGTCWDRILFCAKESVYKAWSPATGRRLGFDEADVALDPGGRTFTARLTVPGPAAGGRRIGAYHGRWLVSGGLIVTAVAVPAAGPSPEGVHPEACFRGGARP